MLTSQSGTSEQDLLQRISIARGTSEPKSEESQVEPTEELEQEEVADEEVSEQQPQEDIQDDIEESEELESEPETTETEDNDLYIDLDGEEIPLSQVKEWKEGNLRQSDYTKKTTELAEQRKAFEAEKAKVNELQSQLSSQAEQLQAIIAESTLSEQQLKELREDDPEEYLNYQEKMQKRQALLSETKRAKVDRDAVSQKLVEANEGWVKDGQPTEKFTQDMAKVKDYTAKLGFSQAELSDIEQNGDFHIWQTLLDAAKGREAIEELKRLKSGAETKRNRKAPTVTRPNGQGKTNLDRAIEDAQKRFKQSGKVEDAVALRKLRKQRG